MDPAIVYSYDAAPATMTLKLHRAHCGKADFRFVIHSPAVDFSLVPEYTSA